MISVSREGERIHRGYSNVFVKYVFYFTSEVDNIYIIIVHFTSEIKDIFNKKHLNFLFIIYYVMKYRKILFKYNAYISQP